MRKDTEFLFLPPSPFDNHLDPLSHPPLPLEDLEATGFTRLKRILTASFVQVVREYYRKN